MPTRGAHRRRADRALVVDRERIKIPVRRLQFRAGGGNRPAIVNRRLGQGRGRRGRRADKNVLFAGKVEQDIIRRGEAYHAVGALIVPWLSTVLPIRQTPSPSAVIVPWFTTPAELLPVK